MPRDQRPPFRKPSGFKKPRRKQPRRDESAGDGVEGVRLQKIMASAGLGSRRHCEDLLKRSNAKLNDDIWVSGQLGNAALALAHLKQQLVLTSEALDVCLPALHPPTARVALGQQLIDLAHSAIDISDGLLADLGHILPSSNLAAVIQLETIPHSWVWNRYAAHPQALEWLLSGGDDYELCFTAPETERKKIHTLSKELATPLTCIGKVLQGEGLSIVNSTGTVIEHTKKGYDHFLS